MVGSSVCNGHGAEVHEGCACERFFATDTDCATPKTLYAFGGSAMAAAALALALAAVHGVITGT
jgi:hypothetical protein